MIQPALADGRRLCLCLFLPKETSNNNNNVVGQGKPSLMVPQPGEAGAFCFN